MLCYIILYYIIGHLRRDQGDVQRLRPERGGEGDNDNNSTST